MGGAREAGHIVAEFGQNLLRAAAGHAGDGVKPLKRRRERPGFGLDPAVEELELLLEELALEHETVVLGEPAGQRLSQLGLLLPQLPSGQVGELLRVANPRHQRLQHRTPGGAEHVRGHVPQLDVGRLQHLLDSVGLAGVFLDELSPVTGQFPELSERGRRDEARAEQSVFQQLGNPLAVLVPAPP